MVFEDSASMTASRWARFGLTLEVIQRWVLDSRRPQSAISSIEKVLSLPHSGLSLPVYVDCKLHALTLIHLEAAVQGIEASQLLGDVARATGEYFRGAWRADQPTFTTLEDAGQSNLWAGYTEIWRQGSLAAALSDDGSVLQCHALLWPAWGKYFDGDTHPWGGSATWNLLIPSLKSHDWYARVPIDLPAGDLRKAGTPHSRSLLRAAIAVAALDNDTFCESLTAYMTHFREKLWNERQTPDFCSVEGTVLWHLARRRGMQLPDLAAKKYRRPAFKTKRPGVKIPLLETTLLDHIMFPDGLPDAG